MTTPDQFAIDGAALIAVTIGVGALLVALACLPEYRQRLSSWTSPLAEPFPLFANAHHRRDFDTLAEKRFAARIWVRARGWPDRRVARDIPPFLLAQLPPSRPRLPRAV